jgi:hypothetical protein
MAHSEQTGPDSALIVKTLKESTRIWKQQESIKNSENITFGDIIQHCLTDAAQIIS